MQSLPPLRDRAIASIRALKKITHTCLRADLHEIDPDDTLFAAIETLRSIQYAAK
jgi:hypothetical protein